jgi:TonB family protein
VSAAAKPAPGAAKPTVAAPAAAGSRRLAILSGALAAAALVAAGVFFWREVAPSAPEVETLEPAPHPVRRAQLKRRAPPAPAAPANPALPPPPPPELFTIQSKPSGAKLIIDGEVLEETTPVEIELDPREKYSLKLELDGYETTGFSFKLTDLKPEQRQKRSLFFPLKAKPAPEVADATPAPAVPSSPAPPVAPTPAERDAPAPAGSGSKALIDPKAPRVRAGAQVDTPRRVVDVKPVVSKSDIKDGVVILELLIDTAGNVAEVKVLRSLTPALDQAAVTAASQWRYEPSVYKGKPANVVLSTTVRFIEK